MDAVQVVVVAVVVVVVGVVVGVVVNVVAVVVVVGGAGYHAGAASDRNGQKRTASDKFGQIRTSASDARWCGRYFARLKPACQVMFMLL